MPKEVMFDEETALQKAKELFWRKGYNGTSMDELTKAMGLSRSSIYNTFGDKQSLFIQSLNHYKKSQHDKLMQSLVKYDSPLKKLQAIFRVSIDELIKDTDRKGCLIVNTTTELANLENNISVFAKGNLEDHEKFLQDLVKKGQQSGEINKSIPSLALARHLFNSLIGLKVMAQTTGDKKTLDDIAKVSLSVLQN
ncbi:TetR/AcrR family transcriptional regulator [Flavihumibacter solisilvae]|uniref:HTH tetR-type domain-containing protein n=1 Tax=Flavihumibacter solisilvae TaxID=1349421 RepID=A0A0C1IIG0_9BACT|nr:TetR/AcrR family transcriptional regulator [Flavihumibacter solisilvae]KIC93975.1 hypothetical protein OI18_13120 [Flavihumibacter solisilvae]